MERYSTVFFVLIEKNLELRGYRKIIVKSKSGRRDSFDCFSIVAKTLDPYDVPSQKKRTQLLKSSWNNNLARVIRKESGADGSDYAATVMEKK